MKKISIIIPSLNQGQFIEKTITSLLDQNYPSLEIIVIDGGSTDDTLLKLKKFGTRIKWISEKDSGQSEAINKGQKMCTGEIIGFVNSDDYLLPNTLFLISNVFEDEKVLWLTGDYLIVDSEGKPIQFLVIMYKSLLRKFSSKNLLFVINYIVQPSTFWTRKLYEKIGEFNYSLQYVMDYDYWIRAYKASNPKIVNKPLSAFRIHKGSKGGSQFKAQFDEELQVCRIYTKNKLLILLHEIHNSLIIFFYKLIK